MATVELTSAQILDAARQLPESERKRLVVALQKVPTGAQARTAVRQMRRGYRLPVKQRERLHELLIKGNAGALGPGESLELDRLVEAFEKKTHDLAQAIAKRKPRTTSR